MDIAADIQKHVDVPVVYFTSASEQSFIANQGDAGLRWVTLSPRERAVFALVVRGKLNKQIASDLHITERTVKAHRARVMRKMKVDSLAALTRLAERLGI
jgi:FixJ family two-component response regulator